MSDNSITPVSGLLVASDDIGGFQFQLMKFTHGADGVSAGDASVAKTDMCITARAYCTTVSLGMECKIARALWNF